MLDPTMHTRLVHKVARMALEAAHTGSMICLPIPVEVARQVALEGEVGAEPVENLHITLFALGNVTDLGVAPGEILGALREVAADSPPLVGVLGGIGRFAGQAEDGGDPVFLSVDVPGLNEFRDRVGDALKKLGVVWKDNHGYTPHMTLSYTPKDADMPLQRVDAVPVAFNEAGFWMGEDRKNVPMGSPAARVAARHKAISTCPKCGAEPEYDGADAYICPECGWKGPNGPAYKEAAVTGVVQKWLVKYFSRPENKKWLGLPFDRILEKIKNPTPVSVLEAVLAKVDKEYYLDDSGTFQEELEELVQGYVNKVSGMGLLEFFPEFTAKGTVLSASIVFSGDLLEYGETDDYKPAIRALIEKLGGKLSYVDNWQPESSDLGPIAGYHARVNWSFKVSDILQAVFTPEELTRMAEEAILEARE